MTFTSFGERERGELGALVRSSDVVVLLSEYEANPVAVMEALALGRKVVVADTSGLTELATNGYATAVPLSVQPVALAGGASLVVDGPDRLRRLSSELGSMRRDLLDLYADVAGVHSR